MNFLYLFLDNLLTLPILAFSAGILFSFFFSGTLFRPKISSFLTFFLLFSIGLKGGRSLIEHANIQALYLLSLLAAWGLIHPFLSYGILRRFTKVDKMTAAAISACFGSISVMTFMAAANFLEKLEIPYDSLVIAALAIMEVPAIISGLFLSTTSGAAQNRSLKKIGHEVFF